MKKKIRFSNVASKTGLWIITIIITLIIVFPIFWIAMCSITPYNDLFNIPIKYIPDNPSLENFQNLFSAMDVGKMAGTTLLLALFTIICCELIAFFAAYGFARYNFPGKKVAYNFLYYSQILPLIIILIPLTSIYRTLHLFDTYLGLVLLYTSAFLPFTTVTMISYIDQIPYSIEEAASVDGANLFNRITRIMFPLTRPCLATMAMILFVWASNEFLIPLLFTTNDVVPLSVGITMIPRVDIYQVPWDMISALATLILIPIIIFVLIFKRNIMEGLTAGGVKQ